MTNATVEPSVSLKEEKVETNLKKQEIPIQKVVVHPLVLLSVVDHFNRMAKVGTQKRVVGILLGSMKGKGVLDISNSFAVPFDEDEKEAAVWFLDHDYLESMYSMFKKVNSKERIVGWYHTGPKLQQSDIIINELVRKYCSSSVLVIIDAKPKELGLPTEAYYSIEEVHDDGSPTSRTFEHIPSEIGAEEAEEVGVEHLLRDIKDTSCGTLSQRISNQLVGIKGLSESLNNIHQYLQAVKEEKLPVNHQILYLLQDIFNLLPNTQTEQHIKSAYVTTNDESLVIYLASLVRSVIALHNLINNKLTNRETEKKDSIKEKEKEDKKKEKEKEKAAKKEAKEVAEKSPSTSASP